MLGNWIKTEREKRGLSQSELARRVGVSSAYVHQLESGKRQNLGVDIAQRLATVFGVTVDELLNANLLNSENSVSNSREEKALDNLTQELLDIWNKLKKEDQEVGVALLKTIWESRQGQISRNKPQPQASTDTVE